MRVSGILLDLVRIAFGAQRHVQPLGRDVGRQQLRLVFVKEPAELGEPALEHFVDLRVRWLSNGHV